MRTRLLGGVGALLTLAAAAVVLRPDLADSLSGPVAVVESQDPERLLLALGFVVGAYAAWAARSGSGDQTPREEPAARFAGVGDPPEAVSAADRVRTGASLDASIEAACTGDEAAFDAVRSTLAETRRRRVERTVEAVGGPLDGGMRSDLDSTELDSANDEEGETR
ncbi:hypothetical protein BRD15_06370 [Halobacteriales archaeon SW_6_65_15]|nr:MAG: hypothetical protein BRD15_06370 [Halobacteriales archaeon SW_6_65_15]